jgi:hypothetical protein
MLAQEVSVHSWQIYFFSAYDEVAHHGGKIWLSKDAHFIVAR